MISRYIRLSADLSQKREFRFGEKHVSQITQALNSMKVLVFTIVIIFSTCAQAGSVELLGDKNEILFDDIKEIQITRTVERLLSNCTTKVQVTEIPQVSYKGVRVTTSDNQVIEVHIFPNSLNSFMIKLYTQENDVVYLHGKYNDYSYQLISMLEVEI